jgi:hypothetical protein
VEADWLAALFFIAVVMTTYFVFFPLAIGFAVIALDQAQAAVGESWEREGRVRAVITARSVPHLTVAHYRALFDRMDVHRTGHLTRQGLITAAVKDAKETEAALEEFEAMWGLIDLRSVGRVDFSEFLQFIADAQQSSGHFEEFCRLRELETVALSTTGPAPGRDPGAVYRHLPRGEDVTQRVTMAAKAEKAMGIHTGEDISSDAKWRKGVQPAETDELLLKVRSMDAMIRQIEQLQATVLAKEKHEAEQKAELEATQLDLDDLVQKQKKTREMMDDFKERLSHYEEVPEHHAELDGEAHDEALKRPKQAGNPTVNRLEFQKKKLESQVRALFELCASLVAVGGVRLCLPWSVYCLPTVSIVACVALSPGAGDRL